MVASVSCLKYIYTLLTLGTLIPLMLKSAEPIHSMQTLRHFETDSPSWKAQNDGVMGGVSSGGAEIHSGHLHFSGVLSLENNGGFAQIYSNTEKSDFSDYLAVKISVFGDGRTYQFRMATEARFRNSRIAYRSSFQTTAGEWTEVTIPFQSFIPSHHGRILSGPELDLSSVREIAFLLGDGNPGAFSLIVDWIGLE